MTSLNGTLVYPSNIQLETSKIGVSLVAASGARRFVHRLSGATPIYKRQWALTWNSVPASVRTIVVGVYAVTVPFVFIDQFSVSWSVQCEDQGYTDSVSVIAGDGTLYFDIDLRLFQV